MPTAPILYRSTLKWGFLFVFFLFLFSFFLSFLPSFFFFFFFFFFFCHLVAYGIPGPGIRYQPQLWPSCSCGHAGSFNLLGPVHCRDTHWSSCAKAGTPEMSFLSCISPFDVNPESHTRLLSFQRCPQSDCISVFVGGGGLHAHTFWVKGFPPWRSGPDRPMQD